MRTLAGSWGPSQYYIQAYQVELHTCAIPVLGGSGRRTENSSLAWATLDHLLIKSKPSKKPKIWPVQCIWCVETLWSDCHGQVDHRTQHPAAHFFLCVLRPWSLLLAEFQFPLPCPVLCWVWGLQSLGCYVWGSVPATSVFPPLVPDDPCPITVFRN